MKNQLKTFKDFWKAADDINWSKWKKRSKRKDHGLKKGDGGLPEGGPVGGSSAMAVESSLRKMFRPGGYLYNYIRTHAENEEVDIEDAMDIEDNLDSEYPDNHDSIEDDQDVVDPLDMEDDSEDPDRQGVIRKIDNAHLVYKRKNEEGKFEELWIYKTGGRFEDELDIKQKIISGTDIQPNKTVSENGEQSYELWTVGNVQFLFITGLDQ